MMKTGRIMNVKNNEGADIVKKLIGLMIALTIVFSLCVYGDQTTEEQKAESSTAAESDTKEVTEATSESADADSGGVTQELIEKNIVGTWMLSEQDGQPALTNEKGILDIISTTEAYISVSSTNGKAPWIDRMESEININDNIVTIAFDPHEGVLIKNEFAITDISDDAFSADYTYSRTTDNSGTSVSESTVKYVRIDDDLSDDIIGTWEGNCTSEGSVFDDGQKHRWEYKDDGTYIYYVKDGEDWVSSENTLNEYFVAGNLLCTRWMEDDEEYREWWEISIDGDKMNWTALREGEDENTFTASFEMKKVQE